MIDIRRDERVDEVFDDIVRGGLRIDRGRDSIEHQTFDGVVEERNFSAPCRKPSCIIERDVRFETSPLPIPQGTGEFRASSCFQTDLIERQRHFSVRHETSNDAASVVGEECTARGFKLPGRKVLVEVVRELKAQDGRGIWLCGGGSLASALAEQTDRVALKIHPVLFGNGIRLFGDRPYMPTRLQRIATTSYESGVVLSEYKRE